MWKPIPGALLPPLISYEFRLYRHRTFARAEFPIICEAVQILTQKERKNPVVIGER